MTIGSNESGGFQRKPPAESATNVREKSMPARGFERETDILSLSQHNINNSQGSPRKEEPKRDSIFENKAQYLRSKRKTEIEGLEADLRKQKLRVKAVEDTMA